MSRSHRSLNRCSRIRGSSSSMSGVGAVGGQDGGDLPGDSGQQVAAGASGIRTGSSVGSLTSRATCGRQGRAVAYHWPSRVVESSPSRRVGEPRRASSFSSRTISTSSFLTQAAPWTSARVASGGLGLAV